MDKDRGVASSQNGETPTSSSHQIARNATANSSSDQDDLLALLQSMESNGSAVSGSLQDSQITLKTLEEAVAKLGTNGSMNEGENYSATENDAAPDDPQEEVQAIMDKIDQADGVMTSLEERLDQLLQEMESIVQTS